jgi:hypothetical protein
MQYLACHTFVRSPSFCCNSGNWALASIKNGLEDWKVALHDAMLCLSWQHLDAVLGCPVVSMLTCIDYCLNKSLAEGGRNLK